MVYHSTEELQNEWVVKSAAPCLHRTSDTKKAVENFRKSLETVKNYHRDLWPGVSIKPMISKYQRCRQPATGNGQAVFFPESTMTTSMFVAYILFAAGHSKRQLGDRVVAVRTLQGLVQKLVSSVGSITFTFRQIQGSTDPRQEPFVTFKVGQNMQVDMGPLFTEEVRDSIAMVWEEDLRCEKKEWVYNHFNQASFQEWLAFSVDPAHEKWLQQLLRPNALSLLSQFAYCLDSEILTLASQLSECRASLYKKSPTSVTLQQKRMIAEEVWSGKERCFELAGRLGLGSIISF